MLSVTADTNIYISGFQFGGLPRRFLDLAASGDFRLDVSGEILREIGRMLQVNFLWSAEVIQAAQDDIRSYSNFVTPIQAAAIIESDPSDTVSLIAPLLPEAITWSPATLGTYPLGSYNGIAIVKVAELFQRLRD